MRLKTRLQRAGVSALDRFGLTVQRKRPEIFPADFDDATRATISRVRAFTATSPERVAALCSAIRYLVRNSIPGAIIECGVWRGGSMMAIAHTLLELGAPDRDLYLYDTFAGMPPPGDSDIRTSDGKTANEVLRERGPHAIGNAWCVASMEEVQYNVYGTGYPQERIHFVPGLVEETLPGGAPEKIALVRLDTDWYESTKHELVHLYPRVVSGGVVVFDDYGEWGGAQRAVDEYFAALDRSPLLCRVDQGGRVAVVSADRP